MANYIRIGEPKNEAERLGMRALREQLPEHFLVLGNFELSIPQRANSLEFDAVVVGEHGLYAVEIKGWSGEITGNPRRWFLEWGPVENPFIRTDSKAKALRDFLVRRVDSFPAEVFVEPVVLLPYAVDLSLDDPRSERVVGVDDLWDFFVDMERIRERGPGHLLDVEFSESVHQALLPWASPARNRALVPNHEVIAELQTDGRNAEYIAKHRFLKGRGKVRVKQYRLDPLSDDSARHSMMKEVLREMEALTALEDNPYVARSYEMHTDADDDHVLYVVMEWVGGQTLADAIAEAHRGEIDAALDCNGIAEHLLRALSFIHDRGIIHRELGPRCIHMRKGKPGAPFKIVDFDHARVTDFSSIASDLDQIGAVGYTAPELWQSETHDHRVDYFSAGAILFELYTGKRLLEGLVELMDPQPVWQSRKGLVEDPDVRDMLGRLLADDPEDRPDNLATCVDFFAARKNPDATS